MKGLLLKDYYMAIRYCRAFLVVALVFIGVSTVSEGNASTLIYPIVFCGMMPVTLIGYEERSRWITYCETFPYSRSQIVSCKYIFTAIVVAGIIVLTAISQAIRMAGSGTMEIMSYINLLSVLFMIGLAGPGIFLPFIFKLGVEKGRIGYYIIIGTACAVGAILTVQKPDAMFSIGANWIPVVCILIGFVIFAVSWRLSIRFYENREL